MNTVMHPHGNTSPSSSHGAHVGKEGHKGGTGAKVKDPGGFTSRMEHAGAVTGHDTAAPKVTKGTV